MSARCIVCGYESEILDEDERLVHDSDGLHYIDVIVPDDEIRSER
jgi:hypothetical protein